MKSGIKTTEFWMSLASQLGAVAIALNAIPHMDEITATWKVIMSAVIAIAALLNSFGYTKWRTWLKAKGIDVPEKLPTTPPNA